MAIQGDGFFMESDGVGTTYTRDGAFDIALDGSLANPASGLKVQGWQADAAGKIDITQPITNLVIPIGQRTTALATSHVTLSGNLDAGATAAVAGPPPSPQPPCRRPWTVFDSLGVSHSVKVTFTKTGANTWSWAATKDPADTGIGVSAAVPGVNDGTLTYTSAASSRPRRHPELHLPDGATSTTPKIDLTQMTQFSGVSQPAGQTDGFTSGTLVTFARRRRRHSVRRLQQAARRRSWARSHWPTSSLRRPPASRPEHFSATSASGAANIGAAGHRRPRHGDHGRARNVERRPGHPVHRHDYRGTRLPANSRVITTSDEMLQNWSTSSARTDTNCAGPGPLPSPARPLQIH